MGIPNLETFQHDAVPARSSQLPAPSSQLPRSIIPAPCSIIWLTSSIIWLPCSIIQVAKLVCKCVCSVPVASCLLASMVRFQGLVRYFYVCKPLKQNFPSHSCSIPYKQITLKIWKVSEPESPPALHQGGWGQGQATTG